MRSSSTPPAPPRTGMPRSSKNTQNGCPKTPSTCHDSPVLSQTIGNEKAPKVSTKSVASSRLSRAPMPMKLNCGLSRANCSITGASARQSGQCGAQNHAKSGPGSAIELRLISAPETRSTTSAEGRITDIGAGSATAVAGVSVAGGVSAASGVVGSGAVVSGAVVSGAVVSGAVVSGVVVSGAVICGAVATTELWSDPLNSSAGPHAPATSANARRSAGVSGEFAKWDRSVRTPVVFIRLPRVWVRAGRRLPVRVRRTLPAGPANCQGSFRWLPSEWPPIRALACTAYRCG